MSRSFAKALVLIPLVLILVLFAIDRIANRLHAVHSIGYHLPRSFPVGAAARLVAHADMNGDGKEDLIFVGESQRMHEGVLEILEGNGDGTFHEGKSIDLQTPVLALTIADIDGDGRPDLILLYPGVTVLINTTPHPGAPVSFGSEIGWVGGFGPLAAADLNGDGKAEVLLATRPNRNAWDEHGTLRIASSPVFVDASHVLGEVPTIDIPIPGAPVSIAVADFDGDGKPDVAVGFTGPPPERRSGVAVLLNRTQNSTSAIHFADPILLQFDHPLAFIAAADLNGDGRNDIFAAWCGDGKEPCAAVSLLNRRVATGGINFTSQNIPLEVEHASNWLLHDINHDGKSDLLLLNRVPGPLVPERTPAQIVVALGVSNGEFAPPRAFSAPTSNSIGMALADFNRDGHPDLAVLDSANAERARVSIFLGTKHAGFDAPESLTVGFVPATAIPFSNHGQATGFVVKAGHTAKVYAANSLDPPYEPVYTVTDVPDGAIAMGDLNADGRIEMVVAAASGIQVYDLEDKDRNHAVRVASSQPIEITYATTTQRAILLDLNGDGKPDLIVGNAYDQSLAVYMNTGASALRGFSFAEPVPLSWCPKGSMPWIATVLPILSLELLSADLNADGKPDLIVSGYCGLSVMLNRTSNHGSLAFDSPVPLMDATGQPFHSAVVVLGDINRDGKPDLVVAQSVYAMNGGKTSTVDVLLNETTSAPGFRLAQHLTIPMQVASVAIGDFDQDGWPDMAVADTVEGTLTFLLNDGQWKSKGAFTIHSSFNVMPGLRQVLVIDRPEGGLPRLLLRNDESVAIVQR